jgi:hypothetical protein
MNIPVFPGSVAWYATGRFYGTADGGLFDAGYFIHLEGIYADLFRGGQVGEATAFLTFIADPFKSVPVTNGDLTLGLDAAGEVNVYLNREAGASFDDPTSFARGEQVARFRRTSLVMGVALNGPALISNVFSAVFVDSKPFELGGQSYDLRDLLPGGVTQWGIASANSLPVFEPYTKIIAFAGSAVAIGPEGLRRRKTFEGAEPFEL